MKFPIIDYSTHPAFSCFMADYIYDDVLIDQQVGSIDRVFSQFMSMRQPNILAVRDALGETALCIGEINKHAETVGATVLAREWLGATLDWVFRDFHYEYLRCLFASDQSSQSRLAASMQEQLQTLESTGMYLVDLDQRDYSRIRRLALAMISELRRRAEEDPAIRAVHSPSRVSPLGRAIQRAMARAGVLDVLSHYKNNRMRILGTGLEYSCSSQTWHSGVYSDLGLPDSPLRYLHVDEADHLPKAIFYATPMTPETGPTKFIPESNCWQRSEFLFRAHKGLDRVLFNRYSRYTEGADYRAPARSSELRRIFVRLPKVFQGTSHLGDDILPGSDLESVLSSLEVEFLNLDGAQAIVFDGPRALHRGALVRSGERMAMQVIFKNVSDRKVTAELNGGTYARRFLKRVRSLVRMSLHG